MTKEKQTKKPVPALWVASTLALLALAPGAAVAEENPDDGSILDERLQGYDMECATVIWETSWFWASFGGTDIPAAARASGLDAIEAACGWGVFPATSDGLPIIPMPAAVDGRVVGAMEYDPEQKICGTGDDWCSYYLFYGECQMPEFLAFRGTVSAPLLVA